MSDEDITEIDLTECLAFLELEYNDGESKLEIPLYPDQQLVIGRDRKCHAIMDDRVSKQHFRLYSIVYEYKRHPAFPPLIYCEDLESYNGTYVNDVLIGKLSHERKAHLLCDGDTVEIRPLWKFRFNQVNHELLVRENFQWEDLKYFGDQYTVSERKLGNGRFGDVFLAHEVETTKQVACKIVDLNLASQQLADSHSSVPSDTTWEAGLRLAREEKRKILREIGILAKLSHPNVVDLKKAFCSHNALYIFTELATGGDLYSYMQSHGGYLDDYQCRFITRQIALALQYIHSKGVSHRDIKPENVLVSGTHFGGRAILTDFGLAIDTSPGTGRMMSKVGTEGFVAPEVQVVDDTNIGYTRAADMWSLGCLTACMFTGDTVIPRQELPELSYIEIAQRYLGVDDSVARMEWLRIPSRALRFIRRLLIVDPEERMAADEAVNDSWYTKPPREAQALNEAIEKTNRSWRKRDSDVELLEGLPGIILPSTVTPDIPPVKTRRKFPDASLSPYFGLDRHLQQREPSTRKKLLDDLSQSGSQFVVSQEPWVSSHSVNISIRRSKLHDIISVEGSDMFKPLNEESSMLEYGRGLDEVKLDSSTPMSRVENTEPSNISDSIQVVDTDGFLEDVAYKRTRKESEEMRVHNAAAKELPRYTTAKTLKDTVNRMRDNAIQQ